MGTASNGDCTLREAIIATNINAVVDDCVVDANLNKITLLTGTYTLSQTGPVDDTAAFGDLDITDTLTIVGQGSDLTIIDAASLSDRVFHILTATVTISGVSIQRGGTVSIGGGLYNQGGALTLTNVIVQSNTLSIDEGGGIFNTDGPVTLIDSVVRENESATHGGGIIISNAANSSLALIRTQVLSNTSGTGGGVFNANRTKIEDSTIAYNSANNASFGGGGIYVTDSPSVLTLTHSSVHSNSASGDGGGMMANSGGLWILNSEINDNATDDYGGGIYITDSVTLVISRSVIDFNRVQNPGGIAEGGGIFAFNSAIFMEQSAVADNEVGPDIQSYGGGLYLENSVAHIKQSVIEENQALEQLISNDGVGGGLYINQSAVYITDTTISHNRADDEGGGISIVNAGSSVNLLNSTLSRNDAPVAGAGIIANNGSLTIEHTSVVSNIGNGLAVQGPGSIAVANTIVANNLTSDCLYLSGPILSNGYNLSSDTTCTSFIASGDITDTNPLLGPLQDNGGFTVGPSPGEVIMTHEPMSSSLVVNGGNPVFFPPPSNDQRGSGFFRVQFTRLDIGAIELQEPIPTCFAQLLSNSSTYSSETASAIRDAVDNAPTGDLVKVSGYCPGVEQRAGTTQTLYISKSLTIRGGYTISDWNTSDPDLTPSILDATDMGRVVYLTGTETITLENMSLINGDAFYGGGLNQGGGIYQAGDDAVLSVLRLEDNIADEGGGAYLLKGQTLITGGHVHSNGALHGGGIYLNGPAQASIDFLTVVSNSAFIAGGGIYVGDNAWLNINSNTDIIDNQVTDFNGHGGGIYGQGTIDIDGGQIVSNSVFDGAGGGIYLNGSQAVLTQTGDTIIANNEIMTTVVVALGGGGLAFLNSDRANYGSVSLNGADIINNASPNNGGGLYFEGVKLDLNSTDVFSNVTADAGGGMYVEYSLITETNSSISNNQAVKGGGAFVLSSTAAFSAGMIGNNQADLGGGLYITNTTLLAQNYVVQNNNSSADGAGLYLAGNFADLQDVQIRNNAITTTIGNGWRDLQFGADPNYERQYRKQ